MAQERPCTHMYSSITFMDVIHVRVRTIHSAYACTSQRLSAACMQPHQEADAPQEPLEESIGVSDWNEWEPIVSRRSRTTKAISRQYDFVLLVHTAHCATSCVGFYYLSEKFPAVAPTGCLCLCARTIAPRSCNFRLPSAAVHESCGARG